MPSRSQWTRWSALGGRFLTVGALSTLIEVAAFNLFYLGLGWDVVVAKVAASSVALVNAYFGNRQWAFRGRRRLGRVREIALFLSANGLCLALGAFLVWLGVEAVTALFAQPPGGILVNVVNLASIAVVVVVRFGLYNWLVFPQPKTEDGQDPRRSPAAPLAPETSAPHAAPSPKSVDTP